MINLEAYRCGVKWANGVDGCDEYLSLTRWGKKTCERHRQFEDAERTQDYRPAGWEQVVEADLPHRVHKALIDLGYMQLSLMVTVSESAAQHPTHAVDPLLFQQAMMDWWDSPTLSTVTP